MIRIDDRTSVVKCRACNLARTYPYPQFNFTSQEKYSDFHLKTEALFRSFARMMIDAIRPYKAGGSFLDIGCAVGYLLDEAKAAGFTRTAGIELNTRAAAAARARGHEVFEKPVEDLGLGRDAFDVVSFNHVIEHIRDLRPFLAEVRRILKPDGVLYCGVPNYDSFMRRLLGRSWYGWGMPDHVWHFDRGTLASLMRENGFTPVSVVRNSLNYSYSKSLRKNSIATFARLAERLGMGDQLYGIFAKA